MFKLYNKNNDHPILKENLAEIIPNILKVGITNEIFKKMFRKLTRYPMGEDNLNKILWFLKEVHSLIRTNIYKSTFDFCQNGNSGLKLKKFVIPKEGYGFFCWFRIEDFINWKGNSCLWSFVMSKKYKLEINCINNKLIYSMESLENKKCLYKLEITNILIPNKWYFIEFYHTNSSNKKTLVI